MPLASFIDDLERLTGMGIGPLAAILLLFLLALASVIVSGFWFFWKQLGRAWKKRDEERAERDAERAQWHAKVENRLKESEGKHEECERDRTELRSDLEAVKLDLERQKRCPRRDCPMRLPG
jgi:Tfp pilus assembly protein PilO